MKRLNLKIIGMGIVLVLGLLLVSHVAAVKPVNNNLASAVVVPWYLSGAVMPVPPYGLNDIPGSDTLSKLIVNQPNGVTEVTITGVMKGLNPLATYTVYVSNGYTPYIDTGWDITGHWDMWALGSYYHDCTLTQTGNTFTGTCYTHGYQVIEPITGTINPMTGQITSWHGYYVYNNQPTGYYYDATGTIASNGAIVGSFTDIAGTTGSFSSGSGAAQKTHTGDTSHTGNFPTVQPFTFMTDEFGTGSWHINLKDANFSNAGTYPISIWINGDAGTILISDTFSVKVG